MTAKIRTCLWFNGDGEEAAHHYVTLLPGSEIESFFRPQPDAPALVINFTLAGTPYQALNAGPGHPHSWAASISVSTKDQAETDTLWDALTANGGTESKCGWLQDRFGLFWQIVPEALPRLLMSPDAATSQRVMQAMMGMIKIDIATIEAAAHSP